MCLQQCTCVLTLSACSLVPSAQRIYSDSRFVAYDVAAESPAMRTEREWAEACLRSERHRNMSEGIVERLDVTLERVKAMHYEARIRAKEQQYKAVCAQLRREHRTQVRARRARARVRSEGTP